MKTSLLVTRDPRLRLIEPDVGRDAALGVRWLAGDTGRQTLQRMGVPDKDNRPSDIESERRRVQRFLSDEDQLNWMIEFDGRVVGTIWIERIPTDRLAAPSISIMIGDPDMRGKGIGGLSMQAVIEYLAQNGSKLIYSRHLVDNLASQKLLAEQGFKDAGAPYADDDGLTWQNVVHT